MSGWGERKMNLRKLLIRYNIDRIFAMGILSIMLYGVVSKGIHDISGISQDNPGDFWRSLLRYIISNLAG